jgi:hypothetical protein
MNRPHLDEFGDVSAVEILAAANADADLALADVFDAAVAAYGLEAVRRMAVEKLELEAL